MNPKSDGVFNAAILAPKDTHPVRELIVTYYVWGVSFSGQDAFVLTSPFEHMETRQDFTCRVLFYPKQ